MAVITSPISGKQINALNVQSIMGLLYEDLATLISGADIDFRYNELERSYGEWGAMIKEGRIPSADSDAVNKNTTQLCPTAYFNLNTRYYDQWTEKVYRSDIRRVELTKILRGEADYADFLADVARRNLEGFKKEVNADVTASISAYGAAAGTSLLGSPGGATPEGFLTNGTRYETMITETQDNDGNNIVVGPTFAEYFSELLKRCIDMTFENNTYTEGNDVYGARMEDLVIYMPLEIFANANVRYLQSLFNMVGIDKLPTIKPYDAPELSMETGSMATNYSAYATIVMDKRVINHVTRYMAFDESEIDCRKATSLSLHVEDMVKYAPFYKAWGILSPVPTNA